MSNPIIDSISTIVNGGINNAPFDYTRNVGVVSNDNNGKIKIRLDREVYELPVYGDGSNLNSGNIVKCVIPENNMNKAFILPPNEKFELPNTIKSADIDGNKLTLGWTDDSQTVYEPKPTYESGKIEFGDIILQWGSKSITTSLGTAPRCYNSEAITFPVPFSEVPCMWTATAGGYANIVQSSYFNGSATGMTLFLTCSEKDVARTVRWYAIGKK